MTYLISFKKVFPDSFLFNWLFIRNNKGGLDIFTFDLPHNFCYQVRSINFINPEIPFGTGLLHRLFTQVFRETGSSSPILPQIHLNQ